MPALIAIIVIIWIVAMTRSIRSYKIEKERIKLSQNSDFNESKRVVCDDNTEMICIDALNKKWSYYNSLTKYSKIFEYNQLIDYEIIENGSSVVQGRVGSTLAGGFLLGGIGALAGAARSRKINDFCFELKIKLFVNDISDSCIIIELIDTRTSKNSKEYNVAMNKAIEFESLLKLIIANSEKTSPSADFTSPSITKKEQLQEAKKLFEEGLISKDEFEKMKKDILGI